MKVRSMFYIDEELHDIINALVRVRSVDNKGDILEELVKKDAEENPEDYKKAKEIVKMQKKTEELLKGGD